MDMDSSTPSTAAFASDTQKSTPWGLLVGLLLILAIIVAGAYYAFTERIAPVQTTSETY